MKRIILLVILFTLLSTVLMSVCSCREQKTLKIGVLLPLTGPEAVDSGEVLDWATDKANIGGGIDGRKVELIYKNTYERNIVELAQEFIDDSSIQVVIGPGSSAEVYDIAPMFIKNKKLLISPLSTAGDVFRAFGSKKFFWRTCQSDVAQIRTILYLLASRDVKRISLIYEDSIYGQTFFNWSGFFSLELGVELLNVVKFQNGQGDFSDVVSQALEGGPDYIICVAFSADAVNIKKELDEREGPAKLFLTDAAETPYLIEELGDAAEGLELTTPAADPASGFEKAYEIEFGYLPYDFAATTYDAWLLSVCTLARYQSEAGKERIEESFASIISGHGVRVRWDKVNEAIALILGGELPDIEGASGPLEFDKDFGVDPIETFYSHCRIETRDGFRDYWTLATISSSQSLGVGILDKDASAYRTLASKKHVELLESGAINYVPKERKDLWAVIIATSAGWENYRHQADALAMYHLLKSNGVNDDKIILFLIDDIASSETNPIKGNVHHSVGGKNLRESVVIDYSGEQVSVDTFKNVMLGNRMPGTSSVLETNENSNILIYIVNHGGNGLIPFEYGGVLGTEELGEVVDIMYQSNKYRQMFIMIEVCFAESMTLNIKASGVVVLASASKTESSFGANYDSNIRAWLSDDFTYQIINVLSREQNLSISDFYTSVYQRVAGSHVRLKNHSNFGDIYDTSISEFISK
ncbi:C13 family peptidase [Chloroflexota bacterium]